MSAIRYKRAVQLCTARANITLVQTPQGQVEVVVDVLALIPCVLHGCARKRVARMDARAQVLCARMHAGRNDARAQRRDSCRCRSIRSQTETWSKGGSCNSPGVSSRRVVLALIPCVLHGCARTRVARMDACAL